MFKSRSKAWNERKRVEDIQEKICKIVFERIWHGKNESLVPLNRGKKRRRDSVFVELAKHEISLPHVAEALPSLRHIFHLVRQPRLRNSEHRERISCSSRHRDRQVCRPSFHRKMKTHMQDGDARIYSKRAPRRRRTVPLLKYA